MSDDQERLKRILESLKATSADVPLRVRLTPTDGAIVDTTNDSGEDDTVWDPNGGEDGPLPCAETPFGCDDCPPGGEAGCYVDENGNIYMDIMVWVDIPGQGMVHMSMLTLLLPSGILVGVYCVIGMGCNYQVIEHHADGDYYVSEFMWSGQGNTFFAGVQACGPNGCTIQYLYNDGCDSLACLQDMNNWSLLYNTPENFDDFDFFIWNGEKIANEGGGGGRHPGLGVFANPFTQQVGIGLHFPYGGDGSEQVPYELFQEMWVIWAGMWGNNPPQPWPDGWTPPDGQGGGGWE